MVSTSGIITEKTLENVVYVSDNVIPAKIYGDSDFQMKDGTVSGFGLVPMVDGVDGSTHWVENTRLRTISVNWILPRHCGELLGVRSEVVANSHFCARDNWLNLYSVCHEDIGAGYMVYENGQYYLAGILSVFTNMCNPRIPAMYTRVTDYKYWLEYMIRQ